jgi:peptide/nickel transport system substrate-binding protein
MGTGASRRGARAEGVHVDYALKQACARAGIDCELKSVVASVFFSADAGNPDTESHFYADLQLSSKILRYPDPQAYMRPFCSWEVAQKATAGCQRHAWRNDEYDRLWRTAEARWTRSRQPCSSMNDP